MIAGGISYACRTQRTDESRPVIVRGDTACIGGDRRFVMDVPRRKGEPRGESDPSDGGVVVVPLPGVNSARPPSAFGILHSPSKRTSSRPPRLS